MGRVDGKVAFITGAARGQGRAHALRLAGEGADVIAVDICAQIETVPFPMAKSEDLQETARLVEGVGRRILTAEVDVRDQSQLDAAVAAGVDALGGIDVVCANAGIGSFNDLITMEDEMFTDMLDTNLTGVWRTVKATVPEIRKRGTGGSIILTSSMNGRRGIPNIGHYTAAKHGVIGLMRALMNELGPEGIRVNCVMPGSCNTPMIHNEATYGLFRPDLDDPTIDDVRDSFGGLSVLPDVPWVEPEDIANAVLFLASDESRYVTGVGLPVDAGWLEKTI